MFFVILVRVTVTAVSLLLFHRSTVGTVNAKERATIEREARVHTGGDCHNQNIRAVEI